MSATRNETRQGAADGLCERFRASSALNLKRWSERLLTAFDSLASVALWGVFASTVVRFVLFPPASRAVGEALAAATLVFLTFATITVYALRETVVVWRESPCRPPKSEFRARVWSASLPLWGTAAVVAAAQGTRDGDSACATACATALYVLCVDVGAARFARRWGATVARDWRLALEDDAASSVKKTSAKDGATFETTAVCGVEEENVETPNVVFANALEEENAELAEAEDAADGETLATQRRVRAEGGGTQIFGSVAVEFEADAEVAPVFIAFCPPFEGVPSFEFEQIAGPEVAVKTTSVQPFGVRIEVKRRVAQTLETQDVASDGKIQIEYFASFPPFDETEEAAF